MQDRRPLAPAAVVKMVVKREDDSIVDVECVPLFCTEYRGLPPLSDVGLGSFFLVTVDLWSGDGKQEMNLVLHPSSSERYVQQTPKSSNNTRRRTSKSGQAPNPTRTPTPTRRRHPPSSPTHRTHRLPTSLIRRLPRHGATPARLSHTAPATSPVIRPENHGKSTPTIPKGLNTVHGMQRLTPIHHPTQILVQVQLRIGNRLLPPLRLRL